MAEINVLEPNVFNKIAAGEVVERPASVIKELVENSIDAGAKNIEIEIVDGGISFMQVIDDGEGIEASEVRKAFLPHATSKIKNVDDLENIFTLGFRGEALASIASVSEVELVTKTANASFATSIEICGGEFVEEKQVGAPNGTQIAVKHLFYNIPVRQKFLKKPKQEENAVSEIVTRLILANPCIAFTYICDDRVVFQTSGNGPEDAIYNVYGANILKNTLPISGVSGEIEINGFISKPTFTKPNTTYQTVIVNGRYVMSKLISTAVARVYEDYLMTRSYPLFLIYINIPNDEIDVNVHPNKLEVRFRNQQSIFAAINHVVDHALMEFRTQVEKEETGRNSVENIASWKTDEFDASKTVPNVLFQTPQNNFDVNQGGEIEISEIVLDNNKLTTQNPLFQNKQSSSAQEVIFKMPQNEDLKNFEPEPVLQNFLFEGISKNFDILSIKIIGKLFNTFVLVEVEDKVYIIDQHAAHERILYDKLIASINGDSFCGQLMLVPYILETNSVEYNFLQENLSNLSKLGFELEEFGNNSFKVAMIPKELPNIEIGKFFGEILQNMNTVLNLKTKDLVVDRFAQTACKHAVKGGDDLSKEEITNLLETIAREEPQLQCPHGRPFVVELKRYDIDKWFKRVV